MGNVFAIKKGSHCGCGEEEYGKYGLVTDDECDVGCLGDLNLMRCGGIDHYSAFEIEWYTTMLLEHGEKETIVTVGNTTVEGRNDQEMGETVNRGIEDFEFYHTLFPTSGMNANQE